MIVFKYVYKRCFISYWKKSFYLALQTVYHVFFDIYYYDYYGGGGGYCPHLIRNTFMHLKRPNILEKYINHSLSVRTFYSKLIRIKRIQELFSLNVNS